MKESRDVKFVAEKQRKSGLVTTQPLDTFSLTPALPVRVSFDLMPLVPLGKTSWY